MATHTGLLKWVLTLGFTVLSCRLLFRTDDTVYASSHHEAIPYRANVHVSVVIDDLGNRMNGTDDFIRLHVPVAVAVMPYLTSSKEDAIQAHDNGHEVLLHIPMEPLRGRRTWVGPGVITTQMSDEAIMKTVRDEIDSIPYVVGVNNHMGSRATSDPRVVRDVVMVAKEKGLFVVDSATSYKSQFMKTARAMGVPCIKRTVFLDDEYQVPRIQKQIRLFVQDSEHRGWGVAIGHVGVQGRNTYRALRDMIPYFNHAGVKIVPVGQLIREVSQADGED